MAGNPPEVRTVRIWEETTVIPTYLVDPPDLNPRFYEGRAYQGAQGRVYPYPIYESLSDKRIDKEYTMVCLENEYIKIEVLPEIGGRLFGAVDKTNDYVFIYRQHVIKPALIGMLGAWISGGIEWNFPHHHRATAFMPVQYEMEENDDGSATVWISELEIRHRMQLVMGITVYPDRNYFEITFKPQNRTPFVHSFLYFANTGVYTNENYQVIFPPSTQFGTYHGKNQFLRWPISHEVYNRVDYTEGVDVSWWKNHPEWTSIFAWNYEDDFVGGYDHGKKAGTLLYSNHHLGAGKKFWTWSTGPRGKLWDEALTETDGPELELMMGGYSDNQPDYSWIQPFEAKYLKQYWYPVRDIGGIKNANLKASVNLEFPGENEIMLAFNTTSRFEKATSMVLFKNKPVFREQISIDPSNPYSTLVELNESFEKTDVKALLLDEHGDTLISYQPKKRQSLELPETVKPPPPPAEIETVEELYLSGLRLEQFYNPSLDPIPYYEEALERDPGNYHVNLAMGLNFLRRGMFGEAENHFNIALKRITHNHTKPRDGEAYYYLGLTQKLRGNLDDAYANLYQACWSQAFHSAAYFLLAEITSTRSEYNLAIEQLERSVSTNSKNTKALNLMTSLLRKSGQIELARSLNGKVVKENPLNFRSMFENYLLSGLSRETDESNAGYRSLNEVRDKMSDYVENYLELALDYGSSGLWEEAIRVLKMIDKSENDTGSTYPMVYYYLAWYHDKLGHAEEVERYLKMGREMPADYCFPFRLESIEVLEFAIGRQPQDGMAPFYLGNLLFEWQPSRARKYWELSVRLNDQNPVAYRNLGMAYNKEGNNTQGAMAAYEKAIDLKGSDQRLLYEQDLIMAAARIAPEKRLEILENHHKSIAGNNVSDALSREIMLHVQLGHYDKALRILNNNYFRQWEGVSKAYGSYVDAHLMKGLNAMDVGKYENAMIEFNRALAYPDNMMVAQPYRGGRESQVYYYLGLAQEKMNRPEQAEMSFRKVVEQRLHQDLSDLNYYRGMALQKLGKDKDAQGIFNSLLEEGNDRLKDQGVDFFAKFGERETPEDKASQAWYLIALGHLGKNEINEAREAFERAVDLNINHVWAAAKLSLLNREYVNE